jgi:hypothetical protein
MDVRHIFSDAVSPYSSGISPFVSVSLHLCLYLSILCMFFLGTGPCWAYECALVYMGALNALRAYEPPKALKASTHQRLNANRLNA